MSHTFRVTALQTISRFLSARWFCFYIAALLLFVISLTCWFEFTIISPPVQVWYYHTVQNLGSTAFVVSVILLILGCLLRSLKRQSVLLGVGLFIPTVFIALAILALLGPAYDQPFHIDTHYLNGHNYNLEVYFPPDAYPVGDFKSGRSYLWPRIFILYECDSANLRCRTLYHDPDAVGGDLDREVRLSTTDDGNITLVQAGKVIYTYTPPVK